MPRILRVLETALYVEDVQRAEAFYREVLGLRPILESERLVAMDAGGGSVLLLFARGHTEAGLDTEAGWIPPHHGAGPAHFAFAIAADELDAWRARLRERHIDVESEVTWPRGGTSLYVRDPDGHSVELATPGLWPTS